MLSYSCVARTLELDAGSLSAKITQQLWPLLCDLYSPWLIPYRNANEHHKIFAEEERGKSFDTAILLPWTTDDLVHASFCVSVFVESVRFILDALPGFNNALSYVWHFYVNNFAHLQVKDHILNVVHGGFLSLPWEKYSPNLQDVELMLKVVNEFLPLSHNFLGNILINIKWTELVHYYIAAYDNEVTTKLHICLLHLFVKLSLEPSLKEVKC